MFTICRCTILLDRRGEYNSFCFDLVGALTTTSTQLLYSRSKVITGDSLARTVNSAL
jgi:hypothetical protein